VELLFIFHFTAVIIPCPTNSSVDSVNCGFFPREEFNLVDNQGQNKSKGLTCRERLLFVPIRHDGVDVSWLCLQSLGC